MKSIVKLNILGIVLLFFILSLESIQIKAQSVNIDKTAYKNVKSAKILVSQDFGKASNVSFPVESWILQIFTPLNISSTAEKYDMIVSVEIKGEALWKNYSETNSNNETIVKTHYTGAFIRACVTFSLSDNQKITKTYENKIEPLEMFFDIRNPYKSPENLYSTPNDAPFENACLLPVYKAIYFCVYHTFGISPLVQDLEIKKNFTFSDQEKRSAAAEILGEVKDPTAIDPLIKSIEKGRDNKSLKKAILLIQDKSAFDPLSNALQSSNSETRTIAATGLGNLKDTRAVKQLISTLNDEDLSVREAAAEALGTLKDTSAVEPLINALNTNIKSHAIEALGDIEDARAVEPLIIELNKGNIQSVAKALGKIKDPRAVEPLIKELKKGNIRDVAEALGKIKDTRAVEPLLEALTTFESSYAEDEIAIALGIIGDPIVVEPLILELRKKENKGIVYALGEIGDVRAVEPLISELRKVFSPINGYTYEVGKALSKIKNQQYTIELLIPLLKDKDVNMRNSIVRTLGYMKGSIVEASLNLALKDEEIFVRNTAAEILAKRKMKEPNATELLVNDLKSKNLQVRYAAKVALCNLTNKDFGFNYREWINWFKENGKSTNR